MILRQLFEPESSTYTYLLADERTREALLIDPVLETVDRDLEQLASLGLKLALVLETHVHADHITGASRLRDKTGCRVAVARSAAVECADVTLAEGDKAEVGSISLEVRETPGHTSGCLTFVESDHRLAFTGDALLIRGCGRTDFQQGNARALYRSVRDKILALPGEALLYPAHDYKGRSVTTVAEERALNPRLKDGVSEEDFVRIMGGLKLPKPRKISVAVPANLTCGRDAPAPVVAEGFMGGEGI